MFGEMVRAYRHRQGMSQEELAEAAGLSVRGISKIEAGRVEAPRPATVRHLADTFALVGADRDRFVEAAAAAVSSPEALVPRQLPPDASGFTGRGEELGRLDALLAGADSSISAPAICVIEGSAGVGKTALAVHWAHRVADQFPEGHIYVNLRGFAGVDPLPSWEALARLMHAFGVALDRIPTDLDMAISMYRSVTARRRMLLVLDNAASAEQVRPLLPTGPQTVVLVTGRDRLRGLIAREGAYRIDLGVLSQRESAALLSRVLGERTETDPAAVAALAELCVGLPLALRIAAANLAYRPRQPIADYVTMLRDGDRLATLTVPGDPDSAVLASFDLSYSCLPPAAQRLFRLLSLVPGPDFAVGTSAAIAGTPVGEAQQVLDLLVSAHLVQEQTYHRYTFHDLLRRYAAARAHRDEPICEKAPAQHRLYDFYVSHVDAAARLLYPEKTRLTSRGFIPTEPHAAPSRFADPQQALAWLSEEHAALVAAVTRASQDSLRPKVCMLADALRGYFWLSRSVVDWGAVAEAALAAAQTDDEPSAAAAALLSLADVHHIRGDQRRAIDLYQRARRAARRALHADEVEVTALNNLGRLYLRSGHLPEAADCFEQALAFHRRAGLTDAGVLSLANLAAVYGVMGKLEQAADLLTQGLTSSRHTHGPASQQRSAPQALDGFVLCQLGEIRHAQGRIDQAAALLTEALQVFQQVGDLTGEARAQLRLAAVDRDRGQACVDRADRALTAAEVLGDLDIKADAHNVLGTIQDQLGHHQLAIDHHRQALELARHSGLRHPEAEALIGLGTAYFHAGADEQAHAYLDQAVTITREHGYPLLISRATAAFDRSNLPM